MTDGLIDLVSKLNDLDSLRDLFSELNFDFKDEPVNKDGWSQEDRDIVSIARVIASKDDYKIHYIQTNTDSVRKWKSVSTKIIKSNLGHCMVCSHNPSGFKWIFSTLSKQFSKSFKETRHIPIDIRVDTGVPRSFVDFLKQIRLGKNPTTVSIIDQMSRAFDNFAIEIHDELTLNVFSALKTLSEGIINDKSNNLLTNISTLEEIRMPIFTLLYRIMFVLYAEDRAIFPDDEFYHKNFSIKWIKSNWILDEDKRIRKYQVQNRLNKLFRLIEVGSEELGYKRQEFSMRPYYGRLFDRKIHPDLEKWRIPNKNLLEALELLTRTSDKDGNSFFLDYAALETRHLGAIYERLLEFHLTIKNGIVMDHSNSRDRKSTGSYYTPKYIVDYMVEHSIGPLIDNIIASTDSRVKQIDDILELNIVDPAMGSGHFLVGATNYIASRILDIEYEDENDIPEQAIVERKRDVVRRCIYGVDLNPLAVDLAQVSLWLETLSSTKPLTFLNAHLKTGNSLIGATIDKILDKQTTLLESTKTRIKFKKTVKDFIMLEQLEDDTASAVKTKIEKYENMQSKGTIYHDLKLLLDAKLAKSFDIDVPPLGDYLEKVGTNSFMSILENWKEIENISQEYSFFHWDLEFLGIFYDSDGNKKINPGFDAVIGNPPYGAELRSHEKNYFKKKYFQVNSTDTAQLLISLAGTLLTKDGNNGFIVPKALLFASNWKKTRQSILDNIAILMDCGKVWKEVNLEQIIYLYKNNSNEGSYISGHRLLDKLLENTIINKELCRQFGLFLSGLKQNEINLGDKIYKKSEKLKTYTSNNRGYPFQRQLQKTGIHKVICGKQIQRWYLRNEIKGYLPESVSDIEKLFVQKNSILVQNLVAHIEHPVPHIKITATIPRHQDIIILDTINQITTKDVDPFYILGLLNSKLVNWYTYRFIFGMAIRTMHFDSPVTDRIPIIIGNEKRVVKYVQDIIKLSPSKTQKLTSVMRSKENKLNHLFYDIFNLSNDEIEIIEKTTFSSL